MIKARTRSAIACNKAPLGIIMVNLGEEAFEIIHGMRIGQMSVAPVLQARFDVVSSLDETARGDGGFGSTGQ